MHFKFSVTAMTALGQPGMNWYQNPFLNALWRLKSLSRAQFGATNREDSKAVEVTPDLAFMSTPIAIWVYKGPKWTSFIKGWPAGVTSRLLTRQSQQESGSYSFRDSIAEQHSTHKHMPHFCKCFKIAEVIGQCICLIWLLDALGRWRLSLFLVLSYSHIVSASFALMVQSLYLLCSQTTGKEGRAFLL